MFNNQNKLKTLLFSTFLTLALVQTPSWAIKFSTASMPGGADSAGVAGATGGLNYKSCNTDTCNKIKEQLNPVNKAIDLYDDELFRLIDEIDNPDIVAKKEALLTFNEKLQNISDKNSESYNQQQKEFANDFDSLINQAGCINKDILTIRNIINDQNEYRLALFNKLEKNAIDPSDVNNAVSEEDTFGDAAEESEE